MFFIKVSPLHLISRGESIKFYGESNYGLTMEDGDDVAKTIKAMNSKCVKSFLEVVTVEVVKKMAR